MNTLLTVPEYSSLRVIPHLLGKLDIKPSLLHGDLWVRFSRSPARFLRWIGSSLFPVCPRHTLSTLFTI